MFVSQKDSRCASFSPLSSAGSHDRSWLRCMRSRRSSLTKRRNDAPSSLVESRFVTSVSQRARDAKMQHSGLLLSKRLSLGCNAGACTFRALRRTGDLRLQDCSQMNDRRRDCRSGLTHVMNPVIDTNWVEKEGVLGPRDNDFI